MSPKTGYGFDLQDGDWTRLRQLLQLIGSSLRLGPTSTPRFAGLTSAGNLIPETDNTYDIGEATTPSRWKNIKCAGSGRFDGGVGVGANPSAGHPLVLYEDIAQPVAAVLNNDGAGDVQLEFRLSDTEIFTFGVDNSDGDKFKIVRGGALGTNPTIEIDSSGNFAFNSGNFTGVGTIAGGTYNGITLSTGAAGLVLDDVANSHSINITSDCELLDNTDGFSLTGGATPRSLTVTGGDWTLDQSVASGAAPTFNNLKIEGGIPILVFKDNTDTGDSARGFQEWRDSNNVRLGYFGNSSYTHDDLVWTNESSGGHLLLYTTGTGKVGINKVPTAALDVAGAGIFTGLTINTGADADYHFPLQAGSTGDYRMYLKWNDYEGNQEWLMGRNAANIFILYDTAGTTHRMLYNPSGITYIDSSGASSVRINGVGDANSGTGGFLVMSGTASPASLFQVTTGLSYFYNPVYMKPGGTAGALTVYFRATDTLFYKPIEIYEGATDALIVYDGVAGNIVFQVDTTNRRVGINKTPTVALDVTGAIAGTPDEITAVSGGTAASIATVNTEVTTNDDDDLDNVTLANGTSGQIKHIYCVASFAGDTWKITPATMCGGTQITFGDNSVGNGCTLVYADNEGWVIVSNNGGTIS